MKQYKDINHLQNELHVTLPRPFTWTLVAPHEQRPGAIHGVPTLAGTLTATNGILVALVTDNERVLIGHADWFEPYAHEPTTPTSKTPAIGARTRFRNAPPAWKYV